MIQKYGVNACNEYHLEIIHELKKKEENFVFKNIMIPRIPNKNNIQDKQILLSLKLFLLNINITVFMLKISMH